MQAPDYIDVYEECLVYVYDIPNVGRNKIFSEN